MDMKKHLVVCEKALCVLLSLHGGDLGAVVALAVPILSLVRFVIFVLLRRV